MPQTAEVPTRETVVQGVPASHQNDEPVTGSVPAEGGTPPAAALTARPALGATNPHRSSRPPIQSDELRRAEVQRHLDARTERLQAYAASLEGALAAHPPGEQAAQLERKLAQVRRDLLAAARPRLPAPRSLARSARDDAASQSMRPSGAF
ncbi:MAG: hypothetical protein HY332_03760 [Chloroflexi bacterium]|nr:hypothetical protein [Chloroflexota bacterium]